VLDITRRLVGLEEEAALVAKQLRLDDQDFRKLGLDDVHLTFVPV
jgi:hypothetical protein